MTSRSFKKLGWLKALDTYGISSVKSLLSPVQDDLEYFDPPGGLLSLDLHVTPLLEAASLLDLDLEKPIKLESFIPHFNLVNAQLTQAGLAHMHFFFLCTHQPAKSIMVSIASMGCQALAAGYKIDLCFSMPLAYHLVIALNQSN